jgi:hypothetical protein
VQIGAGLFVSKHPFILSIQVEPAKIFGLTPLFWFMGVGTPDVAHLLVMHPVIQLMKSF